MFLVDIEFKRIQAYLFQARRLRDMVGANVLLGEAVRRGLAELAFKWSESLVDLGEYAKDVPGPYPGDPLACCVDQLDCDDPSALYSKGILARDGGHFRVVFRNQKTAQEFCDATEALLAARLPGLRTEIRVENIEESFAVAASAPATGALRPARPPSEIQLVDHPAFQICEAVGRGPGFERDNQRGEWVSEAAWSKRQAYKRFSDGRPTHDVIGLMAARSGASRDLPKDFAELCGRDYMAVIHADGNDVGKRASEIAGARPTTFEAFVQREARMETFFQENRARFRIALQEAVKLIFAPEGRKPVHQLLMLGGDDLLLVCRAKKAIDFTVTFARNLKNLGGDLTVGMGIAIADPKVPFHHMHELAEGLSGSAKRLYRRLAADKTPASVVDWQVETGSWTADLIGGRRRDQILTVNTVDGVEHAVLSRRPLPILSRSEGADHRSLEGLKRAADAVAGIVKREGDDRAARSQLRHLAETLRHGRRWSEYAFAASPTGLRKLLAETPDIRLTSLWEGRDGLWTTALRDLVEIFEISKLATAPPEEGAADQ
jgi:hypothetical protein